MVNQGDQPGAGPALSDADTAAGRQQVLLFPFWLDARSPYGDGNQGQNGKTKHKWG